MKHLIAVSSFFCLFFTSKVEAANYWVQVAAYGEKVSDDYFDQAGVKNVELHLDHNLIYRYYIKDLPGMSQAEAIKAKAVDRGFKYAKVVDMDALKELCKKPCRDEDPMIKVIYFDFDRSSLRNKSQQTLDEVSTLLQTTPDLEVKINGHTDAKGSDNYNDALSQRRAERARQYLINQSIARANLSTAPFGEKLPIALNETSQGKDLPEGRQFNRRVELIITPKGRELAYEKVKEMLYANLPRHLRIGLN